MDMENESITIVDRKTTVKTIVKGPATVENLHYRTPVLIPSDGGHRLGYFDRMSNDKFYFKVAFDFYRAFYFDSLEDIWLV